MPPNDLDVPLNAQNLNDALKKHDLLFNEYAEIFPLMDHSELGVLIADIKANGQKISIKVANGEIIDGRNRFQACVILGQEPILEEITITDPLKYVVTMNVQRRHMNETQRAWVAAILFNTRKFARYDVAKMLKVSERSVTSAAAAQKSAIPQLMRAVTNGEIAISVAERISKQDTAVQTELMKLDKKALINKLRQIRKQASLGIEAVPHKAYGYFTQDELNMIDACAKQMGATRTDFISTVVKNNCLENMPPLPSELPKSYVKESYSDKDLRFKKGQSQTKEEQDKQRQEERDPSEMLKIRHKDRFARVRKSNSKDVSP